MKDGLQLMYEGNSYWQKDVNRNEEMSCTRNCMQTQTMQMLSSNGGVFQIKRNILDNCDKNKKSDLLPTCFNKGLDPKLLIPFYQKQILFGLSTTMNWWEAAKTCRKIGLRLGTFASKDQANNFKLQSLNITSTQTGNIFSTWTSGTNINKGAAYWAANGALIDEDLSSILKTHHKTCLYINVTTNGVNKFGAAKCDTKMKFYCEIDERCLLDVCIKKQDRVQPGDEIKCDSKKFFVSRVKFDAKKSQDSCVILGMQPAIPNVAEFSCLYQTMQNSWNNSEAGFWASSYESTESCIQRPCFLKDTPWLENQPEKSWFKGQACVSIFLSQEVQGAYLQQCTASLRFICETESTGLIQNSALKNLELIFMDQKSPDQIGYTKVFKSLAKLSVGSCEKYYCKDDKNAILAADGSIMGLLNTFPIKIIKIT